MGSIMPYEIKASNVATSAPPSQAVRTVFDVDTGRYVAQGNPLLKARYDMSGRTLRLARILVSRLDSIKDKSLVELRFRNSELAVALNLTGNSRYELLTESVNQLMRSPIVIPGPDSSTEFFSWCSHARVGSDGFTTFQVNPVLAPHLLNMKRFFRYRLEGVLGFDRKYTIRFFEWFVGKEFMAHETPQGKSWFVQLDLHEIRLRLNMIQDGVVTKFARWPDFRRKVIEPSLAEIQDQTDIRVSYEGLPAVSRKPVSPSADETDAEDAGSSDSDHTAQSNTADDENPSLAKIDNSQIVKVLFHLSKPSDAKPKQASSSTSVSTEDGARKAEYLAALRAALGTAPAHIQTEFELIKDQMVQGFRAKTGKVAWAEDFIAKMSANLALDTLADRGLLKPSLQHNSNR